MIFYRNNNPKNNDIVIIGKSFERPEYKIVVIFFFLLKGERFDKVYVRECKMNNFFG